MIEDIVQKHVEKVIIAYKDCLYRYRFELFSYLLKQFGTELVVISEVGNPKFYFHEVMEENISLM